MSGGTACKDPAHRDRWVVARREANCSAFNGYRPTPSEYSDVVCLAGPQGTACARWRTRAGYVPTLPDITTAQAVAARLR